MVKKTIRKKLLKLRKPTKRKKTRKQNTKKKTKKQNTKKKTKKQNTKKKTKKQKGGEMITEIFKQIESINENIKIKKNELGILKNYFNEKKQNLNIDDKALYLLMINYQKIKEKTNEISEMKTQLENLEEKEFQKIPA